MDDSGWRDWYSPGNPPNPPNPSNPSKPSSNKIKKKKKKKKQKQKKAKGSGKGRSGKGRSGKGRSGKGRSRKGRSRKGRASVGERWSAHVGESGVVRSGEFVGGTRARVLHHVLGIDAEAAREEGVAAAFAYTYELMYTSSELLAELDNLFTMQDALEQLEAVSTEAMHVFFLGLEQARRGVVAFLGEWVRLRPDVFVAGGGALMNEALSFISRAMAAPRVDREQRQSLETMARRLVAGAPEHAGLGHVVPYIQSGGGTPTPSGGKGPSLAVETMQLGSPDAVAAQVTLLQHWAFSRVGPTELLGLGGEPTADELRAQAPALAASLALSEAVSMWVLNAVLQEGQKSKRLAVRDWFLALAQACLEAGNLCGARDVLMALDHSLISNLKEHRDEWDGKDSAFYQTYMDVFLDARHIKAKALMDELGQPNVPVVVAFKYWSVQADMKTPLQLEEQDGAQERGKPWFAMDKVRILGSTSAMMVGLQGGEYLFEPDAAVQDFVTKTLASRLWPLKVLEKQADMIDPMDPALAAALGLV